MIFLLQNQIEEQIQDIGSLHIEMLSLEQTIP